jgi:hypothetical protein
LNFPLKKPERNSFLKIFLFLVFFPLIFSRLIFPQDWYEAESEHFKVIYRQSDSVFVPHLLASGENALTQLSKIFNIAPSEKIVINPYDAYDFGFGSTTTVPDDFVRLEIEPLEQAYEYIPYTERFQWLLSHELVHILVDDDATNVEKTLRKIFSKVAPEKSQPLTVLYSLLTSYERYTPRWHQEGIAVFMETWLSGGFGRSLGNFDEMYFRSMVYENQSFPSYLSLDTKYYNESFLYETLYYLYGTRFDTYLAVKYGADRLVDWYKVKPDNFYSGFREEFEDEFGISLAEAWNNFIEYERNFQIKNIQRLESYPLTPLRKVVRVSEGWVTHPYVDSGGQNIYFGFDNEGQLAGIKKLNLKTGRSDKIGTLPTPSILTVSSTAYDKKTGLLFYTTNNNELYRDIWVLDVNSGETKELFKDYRIGDLAVCSTTHELWGLRHSGGAVTLTHSSYPYNKMDPVVAFKVGDDLYDLSVSPSGKFLVAAYHKANGQQSLILVNLDNLKDGAPFQYKTITEVGTPENPSWSPDEKYIYWDAYTNGVANIYRTDINNNNIEALSHTITGLFNPIYVSEDSLFAFEFTTKGFVPVMVPNKPAVHLPAINYLGQEIITKSPQVMNWVLNPAQDNKYKIDSSNEKDYSAIDNLKILTMIPVITGFQSQKVVGFFSRISDPLLIHDITLEFGISPFNTNSDNPNVHFMGKYEYKKEYEIGLEYNAPDFFDLFNNRKRGMIGTKLSMANTSYWLYDNPHKIMQKTEIDLYTGVKSINDNLVKVSQPDFITASTNLNSKSIRRSIGSVDYESGNEFNITLNSFASNFNKPDAAAEVHVEWDNYSTWIAEHNVFHFKMGLGYNHQNNNLAQAHYFFGGFGNRPFDDVPVKQFRDLFRFPGIPIYSLETDKFAKLMLENNFPPLRFGGVGIGQHYLDYIDMSVFSSGLLANAEGTNIWLDAGAQINFVFKHWFNLESTLSAGIAKAFYKNGESWQWFLSYKILKN